MRLQDLGGGWLAVLVFALGAAVYLHYGSQSPARTPGDVARQLHEPQTGAPDATGNVDATATSPAQAGHQASAIPANLPPVDLVDPPELRSSLPANQLFAPDPQARAHWASKLSFGVEDRHYVEFNRAALSALKPGSTLAVRLPDTGEQVRIQIDGVQVHANADKSWTGRVIGAGRDVLPVLFTQGVNSSFGSIQTRSRTYSLEADGRMAWIADANALRRHQDFGQPDVRIPVAGNDLPPPTL